MATHRPLLESTVVPDTCVYDSDAGCPCDGIPTKLATAGGKTLILYDIRADGKIYEIDKIAFPDRLIRVKYMKVSKEQETLLVLMANGTFYTFDYIDQKPTIVEYCKMTNPTFAKRQFVTFLPVSGLFAFIDNYGYVCYKGLPTNTTSVYPIRDAGVCSILLIDPNLLSVLCDPLPNSTTMKIYYIYDNKLNEDSSHALTGKHSRLICLGNPFNAIFSLGETSTEYIQINAPFQKFNVTAPPCLINAYFVSLDNEILFSTINDGLILIKVALSDHQIPVFEVRRSSPELQFNSVSSTAGSHFFFGFSHIDHVVAKLIMGNNDDFVFEVLQKIHHLGPIIAVDCSYIGKQAKLIVASGDLNNTTLSTISNELDFCVESRLKAPNVEHIFPLKINSPFANAFIASSRKDSCIFVKNNAGVLTYHSKLHGGETLDAASIYSGEVTAQITGNSISLISLKSLQDIATTERRIFENTITAATIHGASAQILIAMEEKVQLIFVTFDGQKQEQASLMDVATSELENSVTCMTFLNVDFPTHCVFGMEKCSYLDVKKSETLNTLFKIQLPGKHCNPNGLLHQYDQLIVNLKPGLVYVYPNFDIVNQKAGTPKKIDSIYGIDKVVPLDTRGFVGLCAGTDCTVIRKCGARLEYSKLTTNIRSLCDMADNYNRGYFLASNGQELLFGYFQKSAKSIRTNEAIIEIATQNSTKSFAVATSKKENVTGISSMVPQPLIIKRLGNRDERMDSEWEKNPERTVTRILFFPTEGELAPPFAVFNLVHMKLLSCFSAKLGKEVYVIASALEYPSPNPRPIGKLITGLLDKDRRTFVCYLNFDLPHNQIGRPEISIYLNTLQLRQGNVYLEWSWDPTLTTTKTRITKLSSAYQAVVNIKTGVFTAESASSTEVINPGSDRRDGPELLQEAHMVLWAPLSESHFLGGVTDKRMRCYNVDHTVLVSPAHRRRVEPVTVGAVLNVASTITTLRSIGQMTSLYQNGAQAIYGTKSGSTGIVIRMSPAFGDLIKHILSVAKSSDSFKSKYPYYEVLNKARKDFGEYGFEDGEALRLLMRMDKLEIIAILREAVAQKPGVKGPLELYSALEELYGSL